jgi:hypothetical protein
MINTEKSGPGLWLSTGDLDVKIFDLGAPFLCLPPLLPCPHLYAIIIWAASFILFHKVRWNLTD